MAVMVTFTLKNKRRDLPGYARSDAWAGHPGRMLFHSAHEVGGQVAIADFRPAPRPGRASRTVRWPKG